VSDSGNDLLTRDERLICDCLAAAWRLFLTLPELHQWDRVEFMHAIHEAQRIVLARPAVREVGRNDSDS
jgi:hypothetical protein